MSEKKMTMKEKLDEMADICLSCLVVKDDDTDEIHKLESVSDIDVEMLRNLCYDEPEFMKAMKSLYLDLCMTRWEYLDSYIELVKYTELVFIIEQTVMGILLEEATSGNNQE